jgi:predicted MFS family arabinose efflux permease
VRGLPAEVWVVFATTLMNRVGMMALPFLVLYLTKDLHIDAAHAGIALSVFGVGGLVTAPLSGRLADRIGALSVLQLSLALTGLVLLVMPFAKTFTAVLALTFLWAVVAEAGKPATMAALTGSVAPDKRKAAIAVNRLAINLGMSVGPAVGGFLAMVSFKLLFVIDALTSIAAAVLLTALLVVQKRRGNAALAALTHGGVERPASFGARAVVWRDRAALSFFATSLLVGMVFWQHSSAIALYLVRDLRYPESFYGLLFMLNTLLIVAIEVPLNVSMAHWPAWRANALAALLIATGVGALAFATTPFAIAMTVVTWTFGEMMFFPAAASYMADLAPPGRTGEYMGGLSATFSLALIIGPWLGTVLLDTRGPVMTWGTMFVLGSMGAVLLALGSRRHQHA